MSTKGIKSTKNRLANLTVSEQNVILAIFEDADDMDAAGDLLTHEEHTLFGEMLEALSELKEARNDPE